MFHHDFRVRPCRTLEIFVGRIDEAGMGLDVLELPSLSGADEDCGDHLFFRGDRKNLGLDGAARAPPLAPACPNSHSTFDDFSRLACL